MINSLSQTRVLELVQRVYIIHNYIRVEWFCMPFSLLTESFRLPTLPGQNGWNSDGVKSDEDANCRNEHKLILIFQAKAMVGVKRNV